MDIVDLITSDDFETVEILVIAYPMFLSPQHLLEILLDAFEEGSKNKSRITKFIQKVSQNNIVVQQVHSRF
jgi:hypothetical protein